MLTVDRPRRGIRYPPDNVHRGVSLLVAANGPNRTERYQSPPGPGWGTSPTADRACRGTVADVTLRELLRNLVLDETAREKFERDPSATLRDQGFEAVDPSLLGTALVHYADRAEPAEFERLQSLLDRFGPLADSDASGALDIGPEREAELLDLDPTAGIDDLAVEADDAHPASAADGDDSDASPSFGTGSSDSPSATTPDAQLPASSSAAAPTHDDSFAATMPVPDPSTDPALLDGVGNGGAAEPGFELDVLDEGPTAPRKLDDLDDLDG